MGSNSSSALEAAFTKIKTAWVVGAVAVVGQILIQVASYASFAASGLPNPDQLSVSFLIVLTLESILVLALCYGIYKRNKICAKALLIYSAVTALVSLVSGRLPLVGIILAFAAFQGIQGISTYRRLTRQ
ncbi:MAG TPA: hypothetical protein V6D14_25035 [Coleofasciculaceae cyanobacterium]|jgi:hypothetical protein